MKIVHEDLIGISGEFKALEEDREIGVMTYKWISPDRISVNHTYVDQDRRGQGVAGQLFDALVEFLKEEGLKAQPKCSYVDKKFQRRPDLADLVDRP